MRRLLLAAIVAIGAHGILFFTGPQWVLPKISRPKWSVQPVVLQLNAISKPLAPPPKVMTPKAVNKKPHRTGPRPRRTNKAPKPQIKKKHIVRPNPKKVQTHKVNKRQSTRPPQKLQERPKPIRRISNDTEGVKKVAPKEQEVKSNMPVSTEDKHADTSPHNGWADIPDDILSEAPPTRLASLPKATAQEQALVEATPAYLKNPPPPYPFIARKRGYEGTVVLKVFVTKEGRVGRLEIFKSSGHKILDKAAIKTVRKWVFEPGRRGSIPIDMWVRVPIKFVLK